MALRPDYPEAHNNLGLSLELQGRLDEARKHFDRALELAPAFASAHANRAQLRLLQGDFRDGWAEYEWRWRLPGVSLPPIQVPPWDGKPPKGRTVLARAEQGFGDTIQFVRLTQRLKEAGAQVLLECQPALTRLLANAPGVDAVVARGDPLPQCDVQIPLASLPHAFGMLDLDSMSGHVPYLSADRELVAKWRRKLAEHDGFRVGIVWKGNSRHPQDCHRSIPIDRFTALAKVPRVKLFSLQVGEPAPPWLHDLVNSTQAQLGFEETAAIIASLDLVVSCDTATAHLAGALDHPVWVALPPVPDFRWLLDRDDSPWYPSARLFRQKRLGDWEELFARMAGALGERATG